MKPLRWLQRIGLGLMALGWGWLLGMPSAQADFVGSPLSGLVALKTMARASVPYAEAMGSGKPTLLEFYADWCTTCQALAPTVRSLHSQYASQVNFVMIDIDDPQWVGPIQQFQATGVPQITVLRPDQTVADTFVGKVPRSILAATLDAILPEPDEG